jgi:hypothetical protein
MRLVVDVHHSMALAVMFGVLLHAAALNSVDCWDLKYQSGSNQISPFDAYNRMAQFYFNSHSNHQHHNKSQLNSRKAAEKTNYQIIEALKSLSPNFAADWLLNYPAAMEEARENIYNVSDACEAQLVSLSNNLREALANVTSNPAFLLDPKFWSLRVVDAFGKIPSGILTRSLTDYGEFDECIQVNNPKFKGKYCYLTNAYLFTLWLIL